MTKSQRVAYGNTLVELGEKDKRIVALDADLAASTMGVLFEKAHPERHFEMGIAEANMMSVAGGLACTGLIPFASSFAVFAAGRAFDQIRQSIGIGELNVKICGSSAGLSDFGDGATHQSIDDIAIMRVIPGMTVLSPCDANETAQTVRAMAAIDGPCYIRLNRNEYDNVTAEDEPFELGVPKVLREGSDVVVFATGYMNLLALQAAEMLKGELSVKVVNIHSIKPLDGARVRALCQGVEGVVTAEEHSIIGGLGSTIAEVLGGSRLPIEFVGVEDTYGSSAHNYQDVLKYYGLTAEHIRDAVRRVVKQ